MGGLLGMVGGGGKGYVGHWHIICHTVNVTPQANQTVNCLVNTSLLKDNFMQKAV